MVLLRPFLGILKGGVVGALLAGAMWAALGGGPASSAVEYLLYGGVGALAGAVTGQPPWRQGAWVATLLKAIVGIGAGIGLFVLSRRFFHPTVELMDLRAPLPRHYLLMAPAVGALWGMIVEIDDGGPARAPTKRDVPPGAA